MPPGLSARLTVARDVRRGARLDLRLVPRKECVLIGGTRTLLTLSLCKS